MNGLPLEFTVSAVPVAQPRPRAVAFKGHARVYSAPADHPVNQFKATVAYTISQSSVALLNEYLRLSAVFVFPRPKGKCWKKKPMPREPYSGKMDLDNVLKAVKDALNKVLWRDDNLVKAYGRVEMWIAAGDESPHVWIRVEQLETE